MRSTASESAPQRTGRKWYTSQRRADEGIIALRPLFEPAGDQLRPTESASSPWSTEALHGGPPSGILARAAELALTEPDYLPCRLTIDLFRRVPMAPLRPVARPVRLSRRLALVEVSLFAAELEVVRASAVFLRQGGNEQGAERASPPPPFEEASPPSPVVPLELAGNVPPGFHFEARARWLRDHPDHSGAWFCMPMPLVEGERVTPFQRVATLSDFANATSSTVRRQLGGTQFGFINVDTTLYLQRQPEGEWVGLFPQLVSDLGGRGFARAEVYDRDGWIGTIAQASLRQERRS